MSGEWFEVINKQKRVTGMALRDVCHGHPGLMHQVVHVLVVNRQGELFLQKRSLSKDLQPGRWDTSVGGHMQPGEQPVEGALREAREELGVTARAEELSPAYEYIWESGFETEWIHAFILRQDGPFTLDPHEISEGRFWHLQEITSRLKSGIFTCQFEHEFPRMLDALPSPAT